jgi:precorrin-3B synthase
MDNSKGFCPGVATPMETGDGLLARVVPLEPIPIQAFQILCAAAAEHGSGILEVTQRGSLQIRGLRAASAQNFADVVATLGVGQDSGPPLLTSPLLGIEADGLVDSNTLAPALRAALARGSNAGSLSPKVSVLIDGGGKLHLDAVPADIRLRAVSASCFELGLAGDASSAVWLGQVSTEDIVPTVGKLLERIANHGARARAKDLLSAPHASAAHARAPDALGPHAAATRAPAAPAGRPPADSIGLHLLRDGTVARGFGLAFGHTTAGALMRFAQAAAERGATSIRPAPGRAILAIGLTSSTAADDLNIIARAEGFIVEAADPRRHVIACAGSPACASATLPTRQLAPAVANAVGSLVGTEKVVHLSGCTKGCAHPTPAALTIVGPNHWLLNGRAGDAPQGTISPADLVAAVEQLCTEMTHV